MAKIKVIRGGCGISYKDEYGAERFALKMPENGAFECEDAQAEHFVSLGVAEYVDEAAPTEVRVKTEIGESAEPETGFLDPEKLKEMNFSQLKKLATEMGADVKGCKSKADIINTITALEVGVDDEDDDLPDLGAADPE